MKTHPNHIRSVLFACIAMSACGNLVGVIFTNARGAHRSAFGKNANTYRFIVKREIARHQLIPFPEFLSQSSTYGRSQDGFGTPSGGLLLHGIVTCATIAATPLDSALNGGLAFVLDLWGYGHSVLLGNSLSTCLQYLLADIVFLAPVILGFGLFFLKKRMNENETEHLDPVGHSYDVPWDYKLLRRRWLRICIALFFICVNSYLLIVPFVRIKGQAHRNISIPSWKIPAATLPVYAIGAIAGIVILIISSRATFLTSIGPEEDNFRSYGARRWHMEFPSRGQFWATWRQRNGTKAILREAWDRLWDGGEAAKAEALRRMIPLDDVAVHAEAETK